MLLAVKCPTSAFARHQVNVSAAMATTLGVSMNGNNGLRFSHQILGLRVINISGLQ